MPFTIHLQHISLKCIIELSKIYTHHTQAPGSLLNWSQSWCLPCENHTRHTHFTFLRCLLLYAYNISLYSVSLNSQKHIRTIHGLQVPSYIGYKFGVGLVKILRTIHTLSSLSAFYSTPILHIYMVYNLTQKSYRHHTRTPGFLFNWLQIW